MKMETTAKLNNLRMSPRKVRLLTNLVKGKKVDEALLQLALQPKLAARPVKKLIESAVANATHNHSLDLSTLVIKNAFVDGGPVLKRFTPRAFGRASAIHKRTSHITIILEGEADEKSKIVTNGEKNEKHDHDKEEKSSEKKGVKKRTKKEA